LLEENFPGITVALIICVWCYAELMLLGFISLLLTVFQGSIQRTCIPAGWTDYMLPCQRPEEKAGATEEHFSAAGVFVGIGRRLLSDGNIAVEHCHKKVTRSVFYAST
jgi:mlo protein